MGLLKPWGGGRHGLHGPPRAGRKTLINVSAGRPRRGSGVCSARLMLLVLLLLIITTIAG